MSGVIRQETAVFLASVLHGAALTLAYDVLRALRRAFSHNLFAVSLEDFLFWVAAGFLTFCLAFEETDGVIRAYVAAGILLGFLLYHFTFSHAVVSGLARVLRLLFWLVSIPLRILSFFHRKIRNFLKKRIEIARKKVYNKKRRRRDAKSHRGGRCFLRSRSSRKGHPVSAEQIHGSRSGGINKKGQTK